MTARGGVGTVREPSRSAMARLNWLAMNWRFLIPVTTLSLFGCDYSYPGDPCTAGVELDNDTRDRATSLGQLSDEGESTRVEHAFPTAEHSDWFVVAIQDRGQDGNPDIDINLETDPWSGYLEIEAFIQCESGQILELNCSNGGIVDGDLGPDACKSSSDSMTIDYDCGAGGDDTVDNAILFIHLVPDENQSECVGYALEVSVD